MDFAVGTSKLSKSFGQVRAVYSVSLRVEQKNPPPYGVEFGMSAINKANHSGAGSIQVIVPNPAFDAPLIDWDSNWMGPFFMPHLRTCFARGSFPGFRDVPEPDRPNEELEFLKAGLLPL